MDGNVVQNTPEQDTTTETVETQQESMGTETPETATQDGENVTDDSALGGTESAEPFLEIKYNHEKRGLSREEAATLAQKGMHYEDTYNAVERLATLKGVSVKEFVSNLESSEDEAYRKSLMDKFGGDEETVEKMMELHNIKKQQTLDNANKNRKAAEDAKIESENVRIADEFSKMKTEFPELTDFSALPESVKKAAYEGMPLPYAYLLHKHSEAKKIDAAKQSEKEAAEKSTGPINTKEDNSGSDPFIDGIFGK